MVRAPGVPEGMGASVRGRIPWFGSIARGNAGPYLPEHTGDAPRGSLIHLYVSDVDAVSAEFGVPVDEEGRAGREATSRSDGNRLRVATPRRIG